jgi:hypothetical protein
MSEKETIFSSKIKHTGLFSFKSLYKFCYDWLSEETGLDISEGKYAEKVSGDSKEIDVEWSCSRKYTDYFKVQAKVKFAVKGLKEVEVKQGEAKITTNKGNVEIGVKGILERDYSGKFEKSAFQKFLRGIYEKWVIASRIEQYEDKLIGDLDEFLAQTKAFLDLEGKR